MVPGLVNFQFKPGMTDNKPIQRPVIKSVLMKNETG